MNEKIELNDNKAMFGAICEVCEYDWKIISDKTRGRINQTGKILRDAGYTVEDIDKFRRWWYINDWRGIEGQAPTIEDIRDNLKKALTPKTGYIL